MCVRVRGPFCGRTVHEKGLVEFRHKLVEQYCPIEINGTKVCRIVKAAERIAYYPHAALNLSAAELGQQINNLMGGDYHNCFANSGSEANEAGFNIARRNSRKFWQRENL